MPILAGALRGSGGAVFAEAGCRLHSKGMLLRLFLANSANGKRFLTKHLHLI